MAWNWWVCQWVLSNVKDSYTVTIIQLQLQFGRCNYYNRVAKWDLEVWISLTQYLGKWMWFLFLDPWIIQCNPNPLHNYLFAHINLESPLYLSSLSLCLSQASDGSYTGFIKVHLRLSRPVTVPDVEGAGSEGGSRQTDKRSRSEGQEGADCGQNEKRTSFYLPCDCVKQLHISSTTTAGEVIQGLLKKFMVLDNPRKFALYRQTHRDGQGEAT